MCRLGRISTPSTQQLDKTDAQVAAITLKWVQRFVVELALCPFARHVTPHVAVTQANTEEALVLSLAQELDALLSDDKRETTLLIHPHVLTDFLDYNDFLAVADELLQSNALEGVVQIASFHPDYRFSGTHLNHPENFSNRSPYPMLHLLREDSVSRAVDDYPDVEQIVVRNAEVLERLGAQSLLKRRLDCFSINE